MLALAKKPQDTEKTVQEITLRVFDYPHANRALLLAAEGEATRILADAGVKARWVDCPTSRDDWDNYPQCQSAWQGHGFSLRVMPKAMLGMLGTWQDSLGFASDCDMGPYCWAAVFYNRVMSLAGGAQAAAPALLGRVMAHEIGHLLLGENSHSPTGIMRANWSAREFRWDACSELLFTAEQSRRMKSRLAAQALTGRTAAKVAELGR